SGHAVEETRKLLAGEEYDASVVGATDAPTRQVVAAELMTALATESEHTHGERARAAFLQHGYFDDVTRDLRAAEEPQQRASAARTLGLVGDKLATPHLVAALEDPAPEVRRSAVEALTELQDPAATDALEALRWRENSRQLPRKLIQKAIEACAVAPVETTPAPTEEVAPAEPFTDEQTVEAPRPESAAPQTFEPTSHAFDQPTGETAPAAAPESAVTEEVTQELPPLPALAEELTGATSDETLTTEAAPDVTPEVAPDISPAPVIAFEPDVETTQEVETVEPSASTPANLAPLVTSAPAELAAPEILTEPQSYAEETPVELSPAPAPPAGGLLELTAPE
ncbi:MAG TPA: HEAT repeat domain-containing protein, partial [Pyrinomonadaceae bacterium]|nr:HEAT repeat domain-containing protein [Pyrinomonadaceae bacterium]